MSKFLFAVLLFAGAVSHADEKTCTVKGMHCEDCAASVTTKVCEPGKYSTCDAKVLDSKNSVGQIHLVTKDKAGKIDESKLGLDIKDVGYELEKCAAGKPAATPKKKS